MLLSSSIAQTHIVCKQRFFFSFAIIFNIALSVAATEKHPHVVDREGPRHLAVPTLLRATHLSTRTVMSASAELQTTALYVWHCSHPPRTRTRRTRFVLGEGGLLSPAAHSDLRTGIVRTSPLFEFVLLYLLQINYWVNIK